MLLKGTAKDLPPGQAPAQKQTATSPTDRQTKLLCASLLQSTLLSPATLPASDPAFALEQDPPGLLNCMG